MKLSNFNNCRFGIFTIRYFHFWGVIFSFRKRFVVADILLYQKQWKSKIDVGPLAPLRDTYPINRVTPRTSDNVYIQYLSTECDSFIHLTNAESLTCKINYNCIIVYIFWFLGSFLVLMTRPNSGLDNFVTIWFISY